MKIGSVTYKFLDDNIEDIKARKEKQRLDNIKRLREYRKNNLEKIKAYQHKANERNRIERAKGDKETWAKLKTIEARIIQKDIRTFKNLENNTIATIYNDKKGWYYEINFTDYRGFYKSDYFKTKVKAIKDLKLAL